MRILVAAALAMVIVPTAGVGVSAAASPAGLEAHDASPPGVPTTIEKKRKRHSGCNFR